MVVCSLSKAVHTVILSRKCLPFDFLGDIMMRYVWSCLQERFEQNCQQGLSFGSVLHISIYIVVIFTTPGEHSPVQTCKNIVIRFFDWEQRMSRTVDCWISVKRCVHN